MKVLYISSTKAGVLSQGIYYDLMQEFVENGHEMYCAFANEKRFGEPTHVFEANDITYLGIETGNITKNPNLITKGIATLQIDGQFKKALKEHFGAIHFDLVLVSTPPITFTKTLQYLHNCKSIVYLMLKDIFPQNAVDLEMFSKGGLIHRFFSRKELKSYQIADLIGCMSPANVDYMNTHFPQFQDKVSLLPNAIKIHEAFTSSVRKSDFGISENDIILLYGGNVGLPQGPEFIVECLKALEAVENVTLVIAGSGSHIPLIEKTIHDNDLKNSRYIGQLDIDTYNGLTALCDIGLIFLDYRFKIPNYPQRLLSYLKESKPVICATDVSTDIGTIAEENHYGIRVLSNDVESWVRAVEKLCVNESLRKEMGANGKTFLELNYNVEHAYSLIMSQLKEKNYV